MVWENVFAQEGGKEMGKVDQMLWFSRFMDHDTFNAFHKETGKPQSAESGGMIVPQHVFEKIEMWLLSLR